MIPLCQQCEQRPAVVFITQMSDESTAKTRLCEECAREQAFGEGWAQLVEQWGDEANWPPELRQALQDAPLEQIMLELFENGFADDNEIETNAPFLSPMTNPLDDDPDFSAPDAFDNAFDDDFDAEIPLQTTSPTSPLSPSQTSERCANCHTTWDRIRHDGRAGCATCYETFRAELGEVMARVQRGEAHLGKTPRAARKRRKRIENLQTRREYQLELLQNRLSEAVASERYEDAAKLRDKIREI